MKNIHTILINIVVSIIALTTFSCSDEITASSQQEEEKGLLRMTPTFGVQTRLNELPNGDAMADLERGLNNVGIYIYYTEDYSRGDLSQPYIRNMECTVENGELLAVLGPDQNPEDARIFIYNEMTIVAFYPYNAEMSLPENHFTTRADEEKYVITRRDYSQQYYIPYRAQTNTDPTIAYYTLLTFYPKHTYKVEIVVVSDDAGALPDENSVQILPNIDPIGNTNTDADGKRESGFDRLNFMPNGGGGSNVWQYVTYIWTEGENVNNIPKGEILLQSGQLTLIASQNLTVDEQYVYRYGYNMTTGEIFIPTSSQIVHDIPSLEAINDGNSVTYQACDIDLGEAGNWTPMSIIGGRFDGGGHALSNMNVNTPGPNAGLFADVRGNATVCNVNLVNPTITVTGDNAYVGGIAGRLGSTISDAEKQAMIGNLPPGLSPTVREALIQELIAGLQNTESNMVACRVENPVINVTGTNSVVGSLCGQAGEKDTNGDFKSRIWDSYTLGGSIVATGTVGGLCGLNEGYITRSYTTINDMSSGTGFANMGSDFTPAEGAGIDDCFSQLPDANAGVTQFSEGWPSWDTYQGLWPVKTTGWLGEPANSFWYNNGAAPDDYPILQWERR